MFKLPPADHAPAVITFADAVNSSVADVDPGPGSYPPAPIAAVVVEDTPPDPMLFLANANATAGDSTVAALQNIAGLSESDTAVARKDTWDGSDDTMGKSWLEGIASGTISSEGVTLDDLYRTGFGRSDKQMAADTEGVEWWQKQDLSIAEMAGHFVHSEEAKIKDVYHEEYGRDVDEEGLDYWQNWTPEGVDGDHNDFDITSLDGRNVLLDSVQARDNEWEQAETTVRDLLSSELGLHSTDAQREGDSLLDTDGDGVGDIFTDASEDDVFRMMESGDFGASEIADKRKMQEAARGMGDYGGGHDDVGATRIHRMLANTEMGSLDATSGDWVSNPSRLAMTQTDYLPKVTDTITKIKLTEAVNQVGNLTKGKVVNEKQVLTLMRYYELVKEIKNVHTD